MTTDETAAPPQCWRLDTARQTLVLASFNRHLPSIAYWGAPLPADEDLAALARSQRRPLSYGTLDQIAELSISPEEGRGFPGEAGLRLRHCDGRPVLTQFLVTEATWGTVGFRIVATETLIAGLQLSAIFKPDAASGVITAWTEVDCPADSDLVADWVAAPALPFPETVAHVVDYAGRWTKEFGERRVPINRGVHMRESRRGRTGHDHFPALVIPEPGCSRTGGEARAVHLGWSGNHRMLFEELADGRRHIQAGSTDPQCPGDLSGDGGFRSPAIHFCYSQEGVNGLATAFQAHVRNVVTRFPQPQRPRPVHYNCWEAVYFDHKLDQLKDLADRAARLGAERFVLDDGWFGRRDDDTSSLGDWHVDRRKYPDGLHPLIDHIRELGMGFGLWVEPEMINLDSDLARAHPDWIMMPEGRAQVTGRGQHVLDLTTPAVRNYLRDCLYALLDEYPIEYLKWDMNRDLTLAVDRAGRRLADRQTRALYELLAELRALYPRVEIESCASGGGRIDYGILRHTQRVWLSDSNDAHERWRMQAAASTFLPAEIVGSHVGPRRCHTSGRVLSMPFRAAVAMTGHMGFEMDLRELSTDEETVLARYTALYKEHRGWMHAGTQHVLDTAGEDYLAQIFVSADQARFLLFSATMESPRNETVPAMRLTGLDPAARYTLKLVNREEMKGSATRHFDSPLLDDAGLALSGAALMRSGIVLPLAHPDTMWLVEGRQEV